MASLNGANGIDHQLSRTLEEAAAQCGVDVGVIQDAYPCSAFQERAILAAVDVPGLFLMHFTFSIDDRRPEYLHMLKSTLNCIYKRNPILRTRIVQLEGDINSKKYLQTVLDDDIDWVVVPDVVAWKKEMRQHPIRFGQRLAFFVLSESKDRILWTLHHSIYDAFSVSLLWTDLQTLFEAKGDATVLKARPPFNRFSAWLSEPVPQEDLDFWEYELEGYNGPVQRQMHPDRKWPVTDHRTEGKMELIWPELTDITPASLLRFAWACSLMQFFNTTDVLFFSIASGRNVPVKDVREIMGPTVCAVPFRVQYSNDTTVGELLDQIHQRSFTVLEHEHRSTQVMDKKIDPMQRPRHFCNVIDGDQVKPIFSSSLPGLTRIPENDVKPANMVDFGIAVRYYEKEIGWTSFADTNQFLPPELDLILSTFQDMLRKSLVTDKSTRVKDFLTA